MFAHSCLPAVVCKAPWKGPQRCAEISMAPWASKELTTRWWVQAHSPQLLCSLFSIKGWCRRKTLLNICYLLSLIRRKWTIMTMTFRPTFVIQGIPIFTLKSWLVSYARSFPVSAQCQCSFRNPILDRWYLKMGLESSFHPRSRENWIAVWWSHKRQWH